MAQEQKLFSCLKIWYLGFRNTTPNFSCSKKESWTLNMAQREYLLAKENFRQA